MNHIINFVRDILERIHQSNDCNKMIKPHLELKRFTTCLYVRN